MGEYDLDPQQAKDATRGNADFASVRNRINSQISAERGAQAVQAYPDAQTVIASAIKQVDTSLEQLNERISVDEDRLFELKARLDSNRIALETFRETRKNLAIGINSLSPKDVAYAPSTASYPPPGASRPSNY